MGLVRILTVLALASSSCSVDWGLLKRKVFYCQTDDECGSGYDCYHGLEPLPITPEGEPSGYCVPDCEACDGHCVDGQSCLPTCDPSSSQTECSEGLSCLRVQAEGLPAMLAHDLDGICVPLDTCDSSALDCPSRIADVCIADLALEFNSSGLPDTTQLDSQFCIQEGCIAGGSCPEGWSCGARVLADARFDFCAPNCTHDLECPPTLSCMPWGTTSICVPGVLIGQTFCTDDTNCLAGSCVDIPGLSQGMCTAHCATDDDCDAYSEALACLPISNGERACIAPFWACSADSNPCPEMGLQCGDITISYRGSLIDRAAYCTLPCADDRDCESLNGFCARDNPYYAGDVCSPRWTFSYPCSDSTQCVQWAGGGYECAQVIAAGVSRVNLCTVSCTAHAQCAPYGGFCANIEGVFEGNKCFPTQPAGASSFCVEEHEAVLCASGRCGPDNNCE